MRACSRGCRAGSWVGSGRRVRRSGGGGVVGVFRAAVEGPEEAAFVEEAGEGEVEFLRAVEEEGGGVVELVLVVGAAGGLAAEEGDGEVVEALLEFLTDGMELIEGGGEVLGEGDGAALEVLAVVDGVEAEEEEVAGEEEGVALFWGGVEGGIVGEGVGV